MSNIVTPNLRKIADNLDVLADHEKRHGHDRYVGPLRNNAAYLRRAATIILNTEITMGKFADKIHATEKQRDDALARATAAETQAAQNAQAQVQLDALQAAGKIADDADVAALTDDTTTTTTGDTTGTGGGSNTASTDVAPA